VNGSSSLSASDKGSLLSYLQTTELPGIQALQSKVPTDTTCPQLRQDAHSMVYDYRVFYVMTPKADLVAVNDEAMAVTGTLDGLEPAISAWIQSAQGQGEDTSGAQAAFADYQSEVSAAGGFATTAQSATLLAQAPGQFPATVPVFQQARTNLANAANDLGAARQDLATIVADLG